MELLVVGKEETVDALRRRLRCAQLLGHQSILLLFVSHEKKNSVVMGELRAPRIRFGLLVQDQNQARSLRKQYDAVFAPPRRDLVECKAVTHLFDPEEQSRPDFIHHRNSGLNQVLLALCKAHKKEVVTTLSLLQRRPEIVLGRMRQNARWCRKYDVAYHVTSGAKTVWEQRDADGLKALNRELLATR